MDDWRATLQAAQAGEAPKVLVTVAQARGSTPREVGAKLVVTPSGVAGSIGGGNLEFQAIDAARRRLAGAGGKLGATERVPLGPSLGQCCGGDVTLVYETLTEDSGTWIDGVTRVLEDGASAALVTFLGEDAGAKRLLSEGESAADMAEGADLARAVQAVLQGRAAVELVKTPEAGSVLVERVADDRPELWLFGAGHVGRALVEVLGGLSFRVVWVDSRAEEFPDSFPANLRVKVTAAPQEEVAAAGPGALFLVMTHSHPLDLAICEAVLRRGDFLYLGLIGSATKKARFLRQLRDGGLAEPELERLTCPIGLPEIGGKKPGEIAVAVAAQLLQVAGGATDKNPPPLDQPPTSTGSV